MQAHILGKTDSPNWALKSKALGNKTEYIARVIEAIQDYFYMDDYLDSFPSLEQAISVIVHVIQLLKSSGFNLSLFQRINQIKWTTRCQNLGIGNLVITPVEHTLRPHWLLGQIVDVYP